ncbi:sigma-E processing peptidase SpoIIGA [Bacillus sp. V3-13]|uniref:sigma-E processing peptidase SpoIIGA n=1 Tax=Bacillus sp. V3-13 TaxID=2053728 RepID=UPI000C786264|nr:sigma-E processing peptidase SpoIIGA [Bacillus sp. V3-13]PLR77475.1 sigma-E processing peptidase SpoIIGA [Bacillus sp. V3-13]
MTVYLDVIWALNFLFDSLLIYLTAIILKRSIRLWRVFLAGFIGSLIILLAVTPFSTVSGDPLTKLLFSVMMVLAAFGYKRLRYFFSGLVTLYATTFLIGGSLIGAHYFIQFDFGLTTKVLLANSKGFGDPISWLFVLIGFPIAWHLSRRNIEAIEVVKIQYEQLVKVTVLLGEAEISVKGLIDSGNQLYDPLSKWPVMLISIRNCSHELPEELIKLATNHEDIIFGSETISPELENRMRIIPCRVVGKDHQLILALKPDMIRIEKDKDCWETEKGLISFTTQQLSADDAFQCIVHPKLLTGEKKDRPSIKVS